MIRKLIKSDATQTAPIHKEGMPNDFLPSFGLQFLKILHEHLFTSSKAIAYGSFKNNTLQGFIIGSTDTSLMLKEILTTGFTSFLPFILKKLLRNPYTIKFIIETLMYGKKDTIRAELIIISISKKYRRQGIGKKLVRVLWKEFDKKKINKMKVGTLATNKEANSFYKKMGGTFTYSFEIYNRLWNVYVYNF